MARKLNRKYSLEMVVELIIGTVELERRYGWSDEDILSSSGNHRDVLFSAIDPKEWIELQPYGPKKTGYTRDEIFGRAAIIQKIMSLYMRGYTKEEIVHEIKPFLIKAWITSDDNQKIRDFQQFHRTSIVENHADVNQYINMILVEYHNFLNLPFTNPK